MRGKPDEMGGGSGGAVMVFPEVFSEVVQAVFEPGLAVTSNGLRNALIAYWPGNEASGDLLDLHTNVLTLADQNTVTNNVGLVYATARQYTAANSEYHYRADEALLRAGDVDFTFAAWFYAYTSHAGVLVGKDLDAPPNSRDYTLTLGGTNLQFYVNGIVGFVSAAITLNAWHLAVAWHNSVADTCNLQINGGAVTSNSTGGAAPQTSGAQFRVGARQYAGFLNYFNGRIGPVAYWKSAAGGGGVLTAAQRTALYNGGAGLAYTAFTT